MAGNRCFLLIWLLSMVGCSIFGAATVDISVADLDGNLIKQVLVGQPFQFKIIVSGAKGAVGEPQIEESQVHLAQGGYHMSSINGKATVTYLYRAQIDEPGEHLIGTIRVQAGGEALQVDGGRIVAREDEEGTTRRAAPIFARLTVSKTKLYVGERAECTLTLYYQPKKIQINQIAVPPVENIDQSSIKKPFEDEEEIDGKRYRCVRWRWYVVPQKEGSWTIPSCAVQLLQERAGNDGWGAFAFLLPSMRYEEKVYHSNGVRIHVKPVPSSQPVHAVGTLTKAHAQLSASSVRQGEAALLTLVVEGDAFLKNMKIDALEGLPGCVRSYPSKTACEPIDDYPGYERKTIEFVVHGREVGECTIPAQTFHFFSPDKRVYESVSSQPLTLTITENKNIKESQQPIEPAAGQTESVQAALDAHDIAPLALALHEKKNPVMPARLPFTLFLLLLMLPGGMAVLYQWKHIFRRCLDKLKKKLFRYTAFSRARKELEQARAQKDAARLYTLFLEFMATRWECVAASLTDDEIAERLRAAGMTLEQQIEWNVFWQLLVERAFGIAIHADPDDLFFDKAKQWLHQVGELI